jgi:phospholipase C
MVRRVAACEDLEFFVLQLENDCPWLSRFLAGSGPELFCQTPDHSFGFRQFRSDVQTGNLPQVSWIVAPAGYTEHSDWPINYGAWYISQIFDILVSNPEVFSKTVLLINYDEADGSFDHVVSPFPPQTSAYGASTVSIENEIVAPSGEPQGFISGPIGLGTRVPFLAISPWSKGGYVNSQVFDHT